MTEHDTAFLGARQSPEGRVGAVASLQPGQRVSHPSLLQLLSYPPPACTSHLAGATQDPLTFVLVSQQRPWAPRAALWDNG